MRDSSQTLTNLLLSLFIVASTTIVVLSLYPVNTVFFSPLERAFYVGMGAFLTYFVFSFVTLLNTVPKTFSLSILGIPRPGKTVYLNVLFDQLQQGNVKNIQFSPYGHDTIERVLSNLNVLTSGRWLPPTEPGTVSYYRANTSIKRLPLNKQFKIELADYAGEHIGEFDSSTEMWLHKSDFFNYVTQSEGLMLAMDVEYILREAPANVEKMQNAYVAAIQILVEKKGQSGGQKLNIPVTLLFMKSDLLSNEAFLKSDIYDAPRLHGKEAEINEEFVLQKVARLVNVCQRRCVHFKYFYVTSVGQISSDGEPPEQLRPQGVVEPLLWMLGKA